MNLNQHEVGQERSNGAGWYFKFVEGIYYIIEDTIISIGQKGWNQF